MYEYPKGTFLFAAPKSEQSIADAKAYIANNGYDSETVALFKTDTQIIVKKL